MSFDGRQIAWARTAAALATRRVPGWPLALALIQAFPTCLVVGGLAWRTFTNDIWRAKDIDIVCSSELEAERLVKTVKYNERAKTKLGGTRLKWPNGELDVWHCTDLISHIMTFPAEKRVAWAICGFLLDLRAVI